jgi:hypothetical protein
MEARIILVRTLFLLALAATAAGCDRGADTGKQPVKGASPVTVDVPKAVERVPGVTPMSERVAVLGLLDKRNGIVRNLALKPGQAVRVRDAVVRLRACDATAPWENEKLTGAFVQLDIAQPDGTGKRVFSGWLYKESPSLNVVEHAVYDVWPKSCAIKWPEGPEAPATPSAASNRSSAAKSGGGTSGAERPRRQSRPAAEKPSAAPPAPSEPSAAPSNPT